MEARRPLHARVDTSPIVIINVRLASLEEAGCPARLVYAALKAYYVGEARADLVYVDVPFDIKTTEEASKHKARFEKQLHALRRCVSLADEGVNA